MTTLGYLRAAIANANQADRPNLPWVSTGASQKDDPWSEDMGPSYNLKTPNTRQHFVSVSLGLWDRVLREGVTTC